MRWYGEFRDWDDPSICVAAVRPLMAELIGAGTAAADSATALWYGGTNRAGEDVVSDGPAGRRQAGLAAPARHSGLRGPTRAGSYDPAALGEIVLVQLETMSMAAHPAYEQDGTVTLSVRAAPAAVYRVPVPEMNELMWRDGTSVTRWLVDQAAIEGRAVRRSRT